MLTVELNCVEFLRSGGGKGWEWYETDAGRESRKVGFSGKLCAKLMEVWLEHKVAILVWPRMPETYSQPPSSQKKPLHPAN